MKNILTICLLVLPSVVLGKSSWIDISLVAMANSQRVFRGAVFYPYPVVFAGPGITLFGHLSFRGPSLVWSTGRDRRALQRFTLGTRLIKDGEPLFPLNNKFDEGRDYRASRSDSYELYGGYSYRFGFRNLFKVGMGFAQDIRRHRGQYLALNFGLPLYKFLSLNLRTGLGSSQHNRYVYGPSAVRGVGHQDATVRYVIPRPPWRGLVMFELGGHWVLQKANRQADLVRENDFQRTFSTRWFWFF